MKVYRIYWQDHRNDEKNDIEVHASNTKRALGVFLKNFPSVDILKIVREQ